MQKHQKTFLLEARDRIRNVMKYVLLFSLVTNVLMLAMPIYTLQVLDRVIASASVPTLVMLTMLIVGAFVFLALFSTLRAMILNQAGQWLDEKLAPQVIENSVTRSAAMMDYTGSQNTRDLNTIKGFITGGGIMALADAPWSPIFFIIIFLINPAVGFVALIGGVVLFTLAVLTETTTRKPLESAGKAQIKSMAFVETANRNAEIVESMGMMGSIIEFWQKHNRVMLKHQHIAANRSAIITSLSRFTRMTVQVLVVGVGGYLAVTHHLSVGSIIAGSILSGRALAPFDAAIQTWKQFVSARDAYDRLNKTLENNPLTRGTMNMPVPSGTLTANGVFFRPKNADRMLLKGINFRVDPGESMGIIGPSAAGKSTLAKLIVGVWAANQGAIRLDGVDVYKWGREDFGKYVGYLPQDVELFPATIRDNIARLNTDATDEEVIEAAIMAGAHEMILSLPQGYETYVGNGVIGLSPGQRQRLGLARALFRDPRLLVLDEPNSNLDGEGEAALIQTLRRAREKRITVVMVAHKPSLVNELDKILMIRDGAMESFGSRNEVLQKYVRKNPIPQNVVDGVEEGNQ